MATLANARYEFVLGVEEKAADPYSYSRGHFGVRWRRTTLLEEAAPLLTSDSARCMPRFVVFDGAPTLEQCRKSLKLRPGFKGTWTTLPLPLPPPPSTSPRTRPPSSPPAVESQFQDADTTMQRNSRRTRASEGGKPPAASQFADADTTGLFSSSSRERVVAIKGEAQESEGEGPPTKRTKRFEESYQEEEEAEDLETNEAAPSTSRVSLSFCNGADRCRQ